MTFLPAWHPCGSKHSALNLFALARPMLPEVPAGGSVLEIGCTDGRWLSLAHQADPSLELVGVDWRLGQSHKHFGNVTAIEANILTHGFPPARFDAVVSLSTIEHIGLGHYHADPKDTDGDAKTISLVRSWLKPGGWCYFDVPYAPEGYFILRETKCRVYDDAALLARFGPHVVLGYTDQGGDAWMDKPAHNRPDTARPYWYVALLIGG